MNYTATTQNVTYECLYNDTSYGVGSNLNLSRKFDNFLSVPGGLLPPGVYVFNIKAISDGVNMEIQATINLLHPDTPVVPLTRISKEKLLGGLGHTTRDLELVGFVDGLTELDPRDESNTIGVEWRVVEGCVS